MTYEVEIIKPILDESIFTKDNQPSAGLRVYYEGKEIKYPDYDMGKMFFFLSLGNGKALKFIHYTKSIHRPKEELGKIIKIQNTLSKCGHVFECDEEIVAVHVTYPKAGKDKIYYGYITDAHPDPWAAGAERQTKYHQALFTNMKVIQKIYIACLDNNIWRPHLIRELGKRKNYTVNGSVKFVDIDQKYYYTSCDEQLENDIYRDGQFPHRRRSQPYQSIEEKGILGARNMVHRFNVMQCGNFKGKTILDIGCNLGGVCRIASNRGAKYCVGIDNHEDANNISRRFYDAEGHKNIRIETYDINNGLDGLQALIGKDKFDYVFALSMLKHVGHKALFDIINYYTKEKCWIEGHAKQSKNDIQEMLDGNLDGIEMSFVDYTYDRGKRAMFLGVK